MMLRSASIILYLVCCAAATGSNTSSNTTTGSNTTSNTTGATNSNAGTTSASDANTTTNTSTTPAAANTSTSSGNNTSVAKEPVEPIEQRDPATGNVTAPNVTRPGRPGRPSNGTARPGNGTVDDREVKPPRPGRPSNGTARPGNGTVDDREVKPPKDGERLGNGTKPGKNECKPWCKDHESEWTKKCKWETGACAACPPCGPDGEVLPAECVGPAECMGKGKNECDRMKKQEGKCKWEYMKGNQTAPGECVGKRGQPECDDKDKNTCRMLAREGKCKWLPSPKNRKTPTGECLGEAECIGKTRRVCHRMRQQEGKCRYKPAPENTVEVNTTIKGVNLNEMDEASKEELKKDVQETVAKAADEEPEAVNVTLAAGSVIVTAIVDLEERIGIMEGEKEGQNVNLVEEMKAVKSAVQQDVAKGEVKNDILTKAKNNEGVKNAAAGEITITDVEATMTAPAATKAPTEAPDPSTSAAPATSLDSEADDANQGNDQGEAVSGTEQRSAIASTLVGSLIASIAAAQ